jgi:putative sterol carrier protein
MGSLSTSTVDRIETYFDNLAKRGHVPLLDHVSGTLEFDIEGADRRWVTVNRGELVVTRTPIKADCVISCDAQTFTRILAGQQNPVAAGIRGAVKISGNLALGLSIQRVAEPQ